MQEEIIFYSNCVKIYDKKYNCNHLLLKIFSCDVRVSD